MQKTSEDTGKSSQEAGITQTSNPYALMQSWKAQSRDMSRWPECYSEIFLETVIDLLPVMFVTVDTEDGGRTDRYGGVGSVIGKWKDDQQKYIVDNLEIKMQGAVTAGSVHQAIGSGHALKPEQIIVIVLGRVTPELIEELKQFPVAFIDEVIGTRHKVVHIIGGAVCFRIKYLQLGEDRRRLEDKVPNPGYAKIGKSGGTGGKSQQITSQQKEQEKSEKGSGN